MVNLRRSLYFLSKDSWESWTFHLFTLSDFYVLLFNIFTKYTLIDLSDIFRIEEKYVIKNDFEML